MSMLRNIWACTHVRCYATSGLAHMFDATQHLGLHTCSMLRNTMGWGGVGDGWGVGGVFLLVYRLVESIYLLCLAVSRLKGV